MSVAEPLKRKSPRTKAQRADNLPVDDQPVSDRPVSDWSRLRGATAASIGRGIAADRDICATDDTFWENAEVVMPARKEIVTMRLDADLLRWFRQQPRYQTRINAILRAYMKSQSTA